MTIELNIGELRAENAALLTELAAAKEVIGKLLEWYARWNWNKSHTLPPGEANVALCECINIVRDGLLAEAALSAPHQAKAEGEKQP